MIFPRLVKEIGFDFHILLLLRFCYVNSVDKHLVKGKIVLCDGNASPKKVGDLSGAAGMLLGATDVKDAPFTYALPTAFISLRNFKLIHSYMVSLRYWSIFSYL